MRTLHWLFTLLILMLNHCCTFCSLIEEPPTACFGLTADGIKSYFTQKACLPYHEHELVGLRVVLGADNFITYDAFVGLRESNNTMEGRSNLKSAEVLFTPASQDNDISNLFIGFDVNGTTLIKLPGNADNVRGEGNSIFQQTANSTTKQKSYVVLKSKSTLIYTHYKIDLIREKVIIVIRYENGIRSVTGKTEPILMFANVSKSHKPSPFSDGFITAGLLTLIIVALLMTIATIYYTLTSINGEKGGRDGAGRGKTVA